MITAAPARKLSTQDLDDAIAHSLDAWRDLAGAHVLITGATGFVGSWLLETFVHAEARLGQGMRATALVRDADAFRTRFPHLADSPVVDTIVGDVREFAAAGPFTHAVHGASAATPQLNQTRPDEVVDLIVRGTAHVADVARRAGARRLLQVSSGSVYGACAHVARADETTPAAARADVPLERFGAAKAQAESLALAHGDAPGGIVARIFGLVGPRIPLDGQFALGQFIGDAHAGRAVTLSGDGAPVRSWLYAADLAAWCWTLLARGAVGRCYNVGSDEAASLWDVAHEVAALASPAVAVRRAQEPGSAPADSFVPSIARARAELGLQAWTSRGEAIRRTWDWLSGDRR